MSGDTVNASIAQRREVLLSQLAECEEKYPALTREADRAVARQMKVYERMKSIREEMGRLDEAERVLR